MWVIFFVLFFLLFIIGLALSRITISIQNLKKSNYDKKTIEKHEKNFYVAITIYLFGFIKIFRKKIEEQKIDKLIEKEKQKDFDIPILKQYIPTLKDLKQVLKTLNIQLEKLSLLFEIGVEDAMITSFLIPLFSTAFSFVLPFLVKKKKRKSYFYQIKPLYNGQSQYKIELDCIFSIKMVHIIYMMYQIMRRRESDKHGRTSNRRTYEYSYE